MIIPLKIINYHLKIHKGLQIVGLEQIYFTESLNHSQDLEYVFSINENAAVTKMKVELREQVVYRVVKKKKKQRKNLKKLPNQEKLWLIMRKIQDFHKQKDSKLISKQKIKNKVPVGFKEVLKYLNNIPNLRDFTYHYTQDIEIKLDNGSPITYWKSPTHSLYYINAKDNQNCDKLVFKLDDKISLYYNIYLYS
ncbi:unnamed protein product [Paramecium sonneborni]|uniref:VIT domain-containing protein n=1 Tax=Paramecium sonneborni TaxID=65129 RepID=A0A8S1Q2X5_9CILI|nr:unnamed protein product [Paramecium sonneborni]